MIVACATAMALGTASGGWRIMKTMGHRIIKLRPINGFAAETAAAATILIATTCGAPVSTTHVISSSIMGVGASRRVSAVRWGVAEHDHRLDADAAGVGRDFCAGLSGFAADCLTRSGYNRCMRTKPPDHELERLIKPLADCLTPESAKRVAALKADSKLQARVDELSDKCSAGTLTNNERRRVYPIRIVRNICVDSKSESSATGFKGAIAVMKSSMRRRVESRAARVASIAISTRTTAFTRFTLSMSSRSNMAAIVD